MSAEYEWDEAKRRSNIRKHGVDFTMIEHFEWDSATLELDTRQIEPRFISTGYVRNRLHVAVYTERDSRLRIISLRRANRREERAYHAAP